MIKKQSETLICLFTVHAVIIFVLSVLLFIAKWFPYGTYIKWMQQWLYRVF